MWSDRAKSIHEWAVSKGWWKHEVNGTLVPSKSWDEQICLFHSEVSEALEHYRVGRPVDLVFDAQGPLTSFDRVVGKPDGVPIELADLAIRLLDSAGYYTYNVDFLLDYHHACFDPGRSFISHLTELHRRIAQLGIGTPDESTQPWAELFHYLQLLCRVSSIDLERMIDLKMEYNQTRPYRHGGKRA